MHRRQFLQSSALLPFASRFAAAEVSPRLVPIGVGHARNSVNSTVFCHPLVSRNGLQYAAWYDPEGFVMLAQRKLEAVEWTKTRTQYKGKITDAHNGISLGIDGSGILHMSWDHHGNPLNYVRSAKAGSLELTDRMPMNGDTETRVTYPEFFHLRDGGLLFLYRDGGSGRGNTLLKRYDARTAKWSTINNPLIFGGTNRNAYTNQIAVDHKGGWHISWCWRDTGDVATNHDVLYACSIDEGKTWRKSTGEIYKLPITLETAEVVHSVPMRSELINTGATAVDSQGQPMIATYWRSAGEKAPHYHVVWRDAGKWRVQKVGARTLNFTFRGGGTRRIPISRPQLFVNRKDRAYVIFRDEERGDAVSVASAAAPYDNWITRDLAPGPYGHWEPTFDQPLWARENRLNLFLQRVGQGDGETFEALEPQMASVLEWTP